jgi:hypothetical protein
MYRVGFKLGTVAAVAAFAALALYIQPATALFDILPFSHLKPGLPQIGYALEASAYPSALPNDGKSQADITVTVVHDSQPAAGLTILGEVLDGGGCLTQKSAVTDDQGVAHFPYRAGLMPAPGQLRFRLQPPAPGSGADSTPAQDAPAAPPPAAAAAAPETAAPATDDALTTKLAIPLAPVTYLDLQLVTPREYAALQNMRQAASVIYTLALSAFPQQLAADGGSMTTVICQLKNISGKPAAGVALTAQLVSGDGQLIPDGKVTDDKGRFYLDFIAGTTPGTAVIRVLEPSSGLTQSIDLTLVKAGPARIKLHYGNPQNVIATREGTYLPCDGTADMPLIAEVTDLAGVPLSGVELKIEILGDATNGWLEVLDPVTDAAGQVEFQYHSGTQPGKVRIRAYVAKGLEDKPGWGP